MQNIERVKPNFKNRSRSASKLISLVVCACTCVPSSLAAESLTDEATKLLTSGKYNEAIQVCDKAIAAKENLKLAYECRGIAHDNLKQHELALADLNKALQLCEQRDPFRKEYYYNRAMCYARMQKHKEAVEDCNQALTFTPNDASFLLLRGKSHSALKMYAQATADFLRALKLTTEDDGKATILFALGKTHESMGKNEFAIIDFSRAIQLFEKDFDGDPEQFRNNKNKLPASYFERGSLYKSEGKTAQAEADLKRARELHYDPNLEKTPIQVKE